MTTKKQKSDGPDYIASTTYEVRPVACNYGVYKLTLRARGIEKELKLICNRRDIALLIADLMNKDKKPGPVTHRDIIALVVPRTPSGFPDTSGIDEPYTYLGDKTCSKGGYDG